MALTGKVEGADLVVCTAEIFSLKERDDFQRFRLSPFVADFASEHCRFVLQLLRSPKSILVEEPSAIICIGYCEGSEILA
jgi:hypothetical protein